MGTLHERAAKPAEAMVMATKMTQSVFLPVSPANCFSMGSGKTVGREVWDALAVAEAVRDEMREVGRGMGRTPLVVLNASTIMMAVVQARGLRLMGGGEAGASLVLKGGRRSRQLFEGVALVTCPRPSSMEAWCGRGSIRHWP